MFEKLREGFLEVVGKFEVERKYKGRDLEDSKKDVGYQGKKYKGKVQKK